MSNTDIKRITDSTVKNVELHAYPELLFEAADLVKTICEKTNSDSSILLKILGFGDDSSSKKDVDKEQAIGKIILNFVTFFYQEYDRENKQPGACLTKLIKIVSEATEISTEILRKTDYRVLMSIFRLFIEKPNHDMASSFLAVNPSI